ncbi:hypothetical protein ACKVMT_16540 [Halobacteriales archaeon Cl-PHB]
MLDVGPFAAEWITAGALVTALGALIKFAGWTWLLAGYSESTSPVPDDVVRDVAGNTVLRVGVGVLVVGLSAVVWEPPRYLGLVVGAVILLAVGRMIYRLNTWSSRQPTG